MMEEAPFNQYEVHCSPANTEQCDNGRLIDLAYIKDLDKHWMDYSVDFIRQMKDSKQPFFLYHATRGCHFDNYPSDDWAGKSRARTVYSDCMVHMDYVLSQLVKALEDTGQLENTLIILSSDNRGKTPGWPWGFCVRSEVQVHCLRVIVEPLSGLGDVAEARPCIVVRQHARLVRSDRV
jgi:hypothetical protein